MLCRRGLKELDLLLESFIDKHYPYASKVEIVEFERLLQMDDHDLLIFILNPPEKISAALLLLCKKLQSCYK